MRLYWEVARRGFRRYATYRGATIGGLFTNTVFGFMRGYVLIALLEARPGAGGYDTKDGLTYVWLTQGLIMTVGVWGWREVTERVRTGAIATDLSRPYDFQAWHLAQYYGRGAFHALARGVPPFLVGALVFDLRLPEHPGTWGLFVLSTVFATTISFALSFIVNLSSFWLLDDRGVQMVFGLCAGFLSGFTVPLVLFPDWLRDATLLLPFAAFIQAPIDVFLEKPSIGSVWTVLALQAFWAGVTLALGQLVLRAGTRKLVIQGG